MEMIQNNSEMINNSVNETGADSSEGLLPGKYGVPERKIRIISVIIPQWNKKNHQV